MTKQELINKLREKQTEHRSTELHYKKVLKETKQIKALAKEEQKTIELLDNRLYGCKLLVEKLVSISKINLETFLTFAMQQIFTDRNYTIKLNFKEDSKRPGLDLILEENGIEQEITDSVGGGILSTLGLLIQIYYIEVYGLTKTLFIDEGLKEVSKADPANEDSKDYLQDILKFLKFLAEERDYTFVIVTHDTSVIEFADKVYTVKNGTVYE